MSREIYAALAGATATWTQLDVAANNLANASTPGFRAGRIAFSVEGSNPGILGRSYTGSSRMYLSTADGALQQTGDPFHVALSGPGFFTVGEGAERRLTRDGRFTLDVDGRLVTPDGLPVQGESGPIQLSPGETLRITEDGRVFGSLSGEIDRLRVVDGPVEADGGSRYRAVGPVRPVEAAVHQGALEASNVDPMRVMVELVEAGRHFEMFQKAMQASDDATARLNQVGGS